MEPDSSAAAAPDADDETIIVRIRDGDAEAYRHLVRRHQPRLFRYAVRMTGDADVAMDLVQNAFIRAYERLDQCREPGRFGQWALAILANESRHHLRRRRRHQPLDRHTASPSPGFGPARQAEQRELLDILSGALARLPVDQREAFLLRHMEGLSYADISGMTGASVSALKQRVHRARETLEVLLQEIR
jgi:RNA polymerase sigma-70 factor (ECF subfamily)